MNDFYTKALSKVRSRRRWLWSILLAVGPIYIILIFIGDMIGAGDTWENIVIVLILLAWVITLVRFLMVRCPKCSKLFYEGKMGYNPWRSSCRNCGLSLRDIGKGSADGLT